MSFSREAATGSLAWAKGFGGAGASTQSQGLTVDGSGNAYFGGGFFGGSLVTGAIGMNAKRTTSAAIETCLAPMTQ